MKTKTLFIRKNGPIIVLPESNNNEGIWRFLYYPGFFSNLFRIVDSDDYKIVLITEKIEEIEPVSSYKKAEMLFNNVLISEGIIFTEVFCEDFNDFKLSNDPNSGWNYLLKCFVENIDRDNSYIISNLESDIFLAKSIRIKSIYFSNVYSDQADFVSTNWSLIYTFIKKAPRIGKVLRKTKETDINVTINLDGNGLSSIYTGIPFFNHMLEQISMHGAFDLDIHSVGDLDVEEHHIIEDTALALGEAVLLALGSKKGIERYGFLLPMDDCLAQTALDFGGRPWLKWDVKFYREKVGNMPTEMFMHFFKSFSDAAKCNLSIKAEGENEHHKIEAVFKAFGKTLNMASSRTNTFTISSTKGTL